MMNDFPRGDQGLFGTTGTGAGGPGARIGRTRPAQRVRAVNRAAGELQRGTPVLLEAAGPGACLAVLAGETATAAGLRDFAELLGRPAGEAAVQLLLAAPRAASLRQLPVEAAPKPATAFVLPPDALAPAALIGLADPTAEQLLSGARLREAAIPEGGDAALTLARLARLLPAVLVAVCAPGAAERAGRLDLLTVPAVSVLAYPDELALRLVRVADTALPMEAATDARVVMFRAPETGVDHLAIVIGTPGRPVNGRPPLVRVHSACFTGDLLGSLRCDCGPQLRRAIARIAEEGCGAVLYLAQEGRGIGLANKLRAYALQDRGLDTLDANRALGWGADERDFRIASMMLADLGMPAIRLLTNNPAKVAALASCGVAVTREPHAVGANRVNARYLATKADRFGHLPG